jgi:SAM-dependent methyltransferase
MHMVGVGYTTDIIALPQASTQANGRIVALMPTVQGAIYWPIDAANHSVLGDEMRPPFMPSSLHRVLMVHAFEHAAAPEELLRVWWQLLAPGGRLMLAIPNRHGMWARFGSTPFTTGTPYTLGAARDLLNSVGFTLREVRSALFIPPSSHPLWVRGFAFIEWLATLCIPRLGGVLVIEAEKQIYAGVRESLVPAKAKQQWAATAAISSPSISPSSHRAE